LLPIDSLLPEIVSSLRRTTNLIIEAAPGAGKTTRVPPALLEFPGEILVLEPRRIAARMAARRVAFELGEAIGQTAGYQVRFEEFAGPQTRLRFLTEGVLTRRAIGEPKLPRVSTVILDEFHERHLETDLALALLRHLQTTRRGDLRIVVMSATIEATGIAEYLGGCPVIRSEGRLFPLDVRHSAYSADPLEKQVAAALETALREQPAGDALIFLPGSAEIRRAMRASESLAARHNLLLVPLYGDLSPAEQDVAVQPAPRRKAIFSTNIAESSVTIEGVSIVIDSGLARIASDSPWTGLPRLEVKRISQASARQRAGRAGRTAPGTVIRLYTAEDFHRRPAFDDPEITRRELSQMCLQLEAGGIRNPLILPWLTPPPAAALDAAETLLDRLGARGPEAAKMARIPVHPRLARLMLDSDDARVAAMLSSGQRFNSPDLLRAIDEPWDPRTTAIFGQIKRFVRQKPMRDAHAVLAAFPDRVGRRRASNTVLLSTGTSATMAHPPSEFFVAIDLDDRIIRLACPIEPDWLLDHATERSGVEWNRQAERVEAVNALLYDALVIDETRGGQIDDEAAAALLAAKAVEAGIGRFVDAEELEAHLARVEFASQHSEIQPIADAEVEHALATLCYGLRSFADVERAASGLIARLKRPRLDEIAPTHLRLQGGRTTKVHYARGKPPWVASRLQDFFGMTETPRIARGDVPLTVHLLAPNQRPVQTTTDLSGFWERLYPQLRRELGRRYPRHAWPEKPF
jgi:ATP-dependent helicase HrpB